MKNTISALPALALLLAACGPDMAADNGAADGADETMTEAAPETGDAAPGGYETVGGITIYDDRAGAILAEDAVIEKLTDDAFTWSEGPVWIGGQDGYVLFSDVPNNVIHKWSGAGGLETFLQPAGYDGPPTDIFREPGTNGLIRGATAGTILAADHGNRTIKEIDLETRETVATWLDTYEGMKFSSPNDLVLAGDGALYFTDPPYGLAGIDDSPAREIPFNGVYRRAPDGTVALVDDGLSKPNGVVLSPDEATLYVAQSDPEAATIFAYDLGSDGLPSGERRVFADLTEFVGSDMPGLPDGMAVDREGNLYATGPGGVRVFAPDGTLLALISTGTAAANVAFGGDGSVLYITSGAFLARVETDATGLDF